MVNANELKIGNVVMYHGEEDMPCVLDAQDIFNISTGYMGNDKLHSPIPLTAEILEEYGFERMPLSSVERYGHKGEIFYVQKSKNEWFVCGYKYYPKGMSSLHHLMNLFYTLTGEELVANSI